MIHLQWCLGRVHAGFTSTVLAGDLEHIVYTVGRSSYVGYLEKLLLGAGTGSAVYTKEPQSSGLVRI